MDQPKRRLPVLNRPDADTHGDDVAPARRPWQWAAFGTLAIVTAWVPLTALAGALASRLAGGAEGAGDARAASIGLAVASVYGVALALGALAGGYLVGRWGPGRVGVREAGVAGLGAAALAGAGTWITLGPSAGILLVAAVTLPFAALGGRAGQRARSRQG
jgi:hypothetical protein